MCSSLWGPQTGRDPHGSPDFEAEALFRFSCMFGSELPIEAAAAAAPISSCSTDGCTVAMPGHARRLRKLGDQLAQPVAASPAAAAPASPLPAQQDAQDEGSTPLALTDGQRNQFLQEGYTVRAETIDVHSLGCPCHSKTDGPALVRSSWASCNPRGWPRPGKRSRRGCCTRGRAAGGRAGIAGLRGGCATSLPRGTSSRTWVASR